MQEAVTSEPAKPKEFIVGKYNIHFEPGVHPFPYADIVLRHPTTRQLRERFDAGDLTAHAWNPQVAERMRQYQPYVIGLDSVTGAYKAPADRDSWIWLPGSPKAMTSRDNVYIVGGDLLHFQLMGPTFFGDSFQKQLGGQGWENVIQYAKGTLGLELVGEHVVLPASMFLLYRTFSSNKNKGDEVRDPARREFLKKVAAGIGTLAVLSFFGKLAPIARSYSPTPAVEDLGRRITDIIKPITRSTWLEGRTALVISKTIESMGKLDLPQGANGSVVMGFPHDYEAGRLLTDKQARMEAIRNYAQEFFEFVYPNYPSYLWGYTALEEAGRSISAFFKDFDGNWKEIDATLATLGAEFEKNKSEEWKRSYIMDTILPFFLATTIYKVREPESYQVTNPKEAIKGLMEVSNFFKSEEVKEAVSVLGNPERFNIEVS